MEPVAAIAEHKEVIPGVVEESCYWVTLSFVEGPELLATNGKVLGMHCKVEEQRRGDQSGHADEKSHAQQILT